VGFVSLRPLRDLFADRRNLHAILGADEERYGFGRSRHRPVGERRHRYGSEARFSRAVRSPGHRALPAAGLERRHCLRFACICASELKPMASRNRRHSLFARHGLSRLAGAAISQRNLARFCPARGELPLFGGPRLLAVGISAQLAQTLTTQ
jgi:hypothetical protein